VCNIIDINEKNFELVTKFLKNCKNSLSTFRYFSSRDVKRSLINHKSTIILECDNNIVGYAHLDRDSENLWLGICIADKYIGLGFGNILMREILAKNYPWEKLSLTVDNDNISAIKLYEKHNFIKTEKTKKFIKMELIKRHDTDL